MRSTDGGLTWTPVEDPVSAGGGGGGGLTDAQLRATPVPVSDGAGSLTVDGTVSVSNFPAAQPVTDNGSTLSVDDGAGSLTVDGTVSVSNFPAAQPVTDNGGSLTVDGTVATSNFPATVDTNSGNKSASTVRMVLATDQPQLTNALKVDGSAVTQPVSGTFWQATQPVSGTVTANAGTGPFPVSDNAGSLTVDAPTGTPVQVQVGDGSLQATVRNTGSSDSLNVSVVDGSGNQITSFGGAPSHPTMYYYHIASTVHVAAASTLMWDVFNADAALIVRVLSIQHIVNLETAVTGVGFEWQLLRTTAVGTGGTAQTAWLPDTTQTALDADIACRLKGTGGATASTALRTYFTHSEETQAGNQFAGGAYRELDLIPQMLAVPGRGIVLRQNQGLRLNQETNSNAGNSGWLIGFSVE